MRVTLASSTLVGVLSLGLLGTGAVACFNGDDNSAKPDAASAGDDDPGDAGKIDATAGDASDKDGDTDAAPAGPVSFKNDLLPALEFSCGVASSCHSVSTPDGRIVFGSQKSPLAVDDVFQALMGPSKELPTMPYVTPSDAGKSYALHKVEGTQGSLKCPSNDLSKESDSKAACGDTMPSGSDDGWEDALDAKVPVGKSIFRRWIEQGAKNN